MNKIRRCIAFWIDMFIITSLAMLITGIISYIISIFIHYSYRIDVFNVAIFYMMNVYMIIAFMLILFKDFTYKNASIGKKLLLLQVLKDNGEIPSKTALIFRNILSFLWPISLIMVLICDKRIEDFIFQTKVVSTIEAEEKSQTKQTEAKSEKEFVQYKKTKNDKDFIFYKNVKLAKINNKIYDKVDKIQKRNSKIYSISILVYFLAIAWLFAFIGQINDYIWIFVFLLIIIFGILLSLFCKLTMPKEGKIKYKYKQEIYFYISFILYGISVLILFSSLINEAIWLGVVIALMGLATSTIVYYFKSSSNSKIETSKMTKIMFAIFTILTSFVIGVCI